MVPATIMCAPDVHQPAAPSRRIPEAIRRIFLETFTVRDIAQPLAEETAKKLEQLRNNPALIREHHERWLPKNQL